MDDLKALVDKFIAGTITFEECYGYDVKSIRLELLDAYLDYVIIGEMPTAIDVPDLAQGWQDFADAATQTTPIVQSNVAGGTVQLTTDNNGTLTDGNTTVNADHTLRGVNDIWNTTSNTIQFGSTGLQKNDMIDARIHLEISPNVIPQDFTLILEFFDGLDGTGTKVFELVSDVQSFISNAGTYTELLLERRFFIGDSIKDGSCVVNLKGSSSFAVKMKGFNFEIRR